MKKSLALVLAILVLGSGGWLAFTRNRDDHQKNQNTYTTSSDPTEGGKYLVIKEWGVRMKKSEHTKDLIYSFFNPNVPNSINFSLSSLAEKYPSCLPENVGISLGLARSKSNDSTPPESFAKVGDYYYSAAGGGSTCLPSSSPTTDQDKFSSARGELNNVIKTVEVFR